MASMEESLFTYLFEFMLSVLSYCLNLTHHPCNRNLIPCLKRQRCWLDVRNSEFFTLIESVEPANWSTLVFAQLMEIHAHVRTSFCCHWQTHAMPRFTPNILYTDVDSQCDKLVTYGGHQLPHRPST